MCADPNEIKAALAKAFRRFPGLRTSNEQMFDAVLSWSVEAKRVGGALADVQKLIDGILSDPRLVNSRVFSGKEYEDEPILRTGAQMKNYLPEQYVKMKALAKPTYDGFEYRRSSETKLFVTQGKYMEQWEDDFPYSGTFKRYYPTYAMMSDQQLRGYFSWRAQVRKGNVQETSLSFAYVYIYELLNGIGGSTPQECFDKLYSFWVSYREFAPELNRYVISWLRDFVVYHELDPRLIESFIDTSFEQALIAVRQAEACVREGKGIPDEALLLASLSRLSSYRIEKSRFAKERPDDVASVVAKVFAELCLHCAKRRKKGLVDSWFGVRDMSPHPMFQSAVFYEPVPHEDCLYRVNEVHAYSCRNGRWSGLRSYKTPARNDELGALLATIDRLMRQAASDPHPLKEHDVPKYLLRIIESAVGSWQKAKAEEERKRVVIDRSQLEGIRSRSAVTREALLIEEERGETEPLREGGLDFASDVPAEESLTKQNRLEGSFANDAPAAKSISAHAGTLQAHAVGNASASGSAEASDSPANGLSSVEAAYLKSLLEGLDVESCLGSESEDIVVDSINEKLFDLLGDTALEYGAEGPQVIEDYREEIQEAIGR